MPLDWNLAYVNDDCPWDKGEAAPPLRSYLAHSPVLGKVLVPGCGLGHDVRLLAHAGATVTGLDCAPKAIERAQCAGFHERIQYKIGDFLRSHSIPKEAYDWVFEHTCLCALDPSQRHNYVNSLCRALKPEAHYLAIFYIKVENYDGSGPPHPISRQEIEVLFKDYFDILDAKIPTESYACRPYGTELLMCMQKRLAY
jgi:SAM-dependent methyltransferase